MSDLLNYSAEADLEARRQADVDAAEESGPGPVTGAELERRARSLATAFVARCNRADLDPRDVLEDRLEAIDDVGDDVDRGDGPVTDGGQDVSASRRRVTSSIKFGGVSGNHVATPGDDMNHLSGEVSIEVSGASTDYPHPTRLQREIEAAVADVLDDYAERVSDDVDRGDGVETDGGFRSLDCWVNRDHLDGVAEQDDTCQNGEERCPGPDVDFSETLPCFDCFLDGGGDT